MVLPDQLGSQAIEPSTDSLDIISYSIEEDSFITENMPYKLVGIMNDPQFGVSSSEAYSQLTITDLNPSLNAPGNTLDSAVLTIRFTSSSAFYGNLNTTQTLEVYEVTEDFPSTSLASNLSLSTGSTPIGTFSGKIDLSDSTTLREASSEVTVAPCFTIKLTNSFANKLFNAASSVYASDDAFKQFLKGIAIKPVGSPLSSEGAIFALSLDDALSKIRIYYNDSSEYQLNMLSSRSFARYTIATQNSDITLQQNNTGVDYSDNYLQSLTGSKVAVEITNLGDFVLGPEKIIHKAELIVKPKSGTFTSDYYLPQRLLALQPDSFGNSIAIPDLFSLKFDGSRKSDNSYALNVTEFLQFQLNTFKSLKTFRNVLHITIPNVDPIAPSRMIIDADKSQYNLALRVVYSEL